MVTPSLDYLLQYTVKRVLVPKEGHRWGIEFSNGAIVYNDDPERVDDEIDENIVGLSFLTTLYGQEDTRLHLGRVSHANNELRIESEINVSLTPGKYSIIDPRFGGEPHTPQQAGQDDVARATIREQFNDARAAEAPESFPEPEPAQDTPEAPASPENGPDAPTEARPTAPLTDS